MSPKEFIVEKLNLLVETFPEITLGYKYDVSNDTHIIAVDPLDCYENNKEYLKAESKIVFEFTNTFLTESILFVSTESLIKIENPEMVFKSNKRTVQTSIHFQDFKYNCGSDLCYPTGMKAGENNYALAA